MAKVKRVLVEGIDVGGPVSGALIKQANRLVESSGLDVSSTAREKILSDLLSPGKYARLLAYMNHSDITGTYAQPGGVKKFVEEALATQADVTDALAFLSGGLKDPAAWLQRPALGGNRMPLGQLNGPEDSVVVLNVPKAALNFTNPKNKEEAAAILEKLLSHNHFVAHLSVPQAKKGLPDPNVKTVEELLDHFNFAAITGYKVPADRQAALAEWKESRDRSATAGQQQQSARSAVTANAHKFRKWIESYRLEFRLPKTEEAAHEFYFKAQEQLEQLAPGDDELQHAVREAGVGMIKPDTNLWRYLVEGNIEHYMKVIKARADAAGEELPQKEPPETPVEKPETSAEKPETPVEKPEEPPATTSAPRSPTDLPKALQTTADRVADNIKSLPAWDPKHRGSLLAAIEQALADE